MGEANGERRIARTRAEGEVACDGALMINAAPVHAVPTLLFAGILLVQPFLQWSKIIQNCRRVHLALSADGFQFVWPGFGPAHGKHLVQLVTCGFVPVDGAAMQWAFFTRCLT